MIRFSFKDGLIWQEPFPGFFLWMSPMAAAATRDYSGLLRPEERAELADVIRQYEQSQPTEKVA